MKINTESKRLNAVTPLKPILAEMAQRLEPEASLTALLEHLLKPKMLEMAYNREWLDLVKEIETL